MKLPRPAVFLRWLLAGAVWAAGIWLTVRTATGGTDEMPGIGRLMSVMSLMIAGGMIVSRDLVGWITLPIHRVLDGIFLPSEPAGTPPVDYHLARFYAGQLRYDEACQEYEKIVHYHPREVTAYLEGIHAATLAGDERRAERFHRSGGRALRSPEKRALLENVYAARHELPAPAAELTDGSPAAELADAPPIITTDKSTE